VTCRHSRSKGSLNPERFFRSGDFPRENTANRGKRRGVPKGSVRRARCFTHLVWKRGCRLTRIVRAKRNPRRGLRAIVQTAGAGDGDRVRAACPFISRFVECPDTSFIYRWLAFFQDAASRVLTRNVFIMRSASKLRARRADRHCRRSRCGEAGPPLFAPASIKQISRDLRRVTKHTRADRLVKTPSAAVLHSSARFSCPGRFHSCSETAFLARRAAKRRGETDTERHREKEREEDEEGSPGSGNAGIPRTFGVRT